MTSLNLATIFGPNLLHKQKNSDKEFSVQSSARAEESTAVIAVLQKMIASYQSLFMVSEVTPLSTHAHTHPQTHTFVWVYKETTPWFSRQQTSLNGLWFCGKHKKISMRRKWLVSIIQRQFWLGFCEYKQI